MANTFFILHGNCIPVKGAYRSIICDLQTSRVKFIPNLLFDILMASRKMAITEIKEKYPNEQEGIDSYFLLLREDDWGIFVESKEMADSFPPLDLQFKIPSKISNFILDIYRDSHHPYKKIAEELNSLNCMALQLRLYDSFSLTELEGILTIFATNRLKSIDILMKYSSEFEDFEDLVSLKIRNPKLMKATIYSAPTNGLFDDFRAKPFCIICTPEEITDCTSCGRVNTNYFTINLSHFSESIQFNSCLNKKLAVDIKGNIKLCPSMNRSFGNIHETSLTDIAELDEVKKNWSIHKDQINICQDCEFRYICTDCRAYTEEPENIFSKPLKCGYDPYTGNWENWSTNPLKQRAIDYYGLKKEIEKRPIKVQ